MRQDIHKVSRWITLVCVLLAVGARVNAVGISGWMDRLRVLSSKELGYDYSIQLINASGIATDSISGHLYKSGKKYLDSNSAGITAVDGVYFFKIDNDRKTAAVYNLVAIAHKLNVSFADNPPSIMSFPDSVIAKYGTLKTDSTATYFIIRLNIAVAGGIVNMTGFISRKTYLPEKIILDIPDPGGSDDKNKWTRRCTIRLINTSISSDVFDLGRFFSVSDNTVQLNKKYSNYKLTSLIN